MRAALLALACGTLGCERAEATASFFVRCAFGTHPSGDGSQTSPFSSIEQAKLAVQAIPRNSFFTGATVSIDTMSPCYVSETLQFNSPVDGGTSSKALVTYQAWVVNQGAPSSAMVSGGLPISESMLQPVSDAWTGSLLPAASKAAVKQIDLSKAYPSINTGEFLPHVYLGGDAEIDIRKVTKTPLELFWYGGDTAPPSSPDLLPAAHADLSMRYAAYPDPTLTDINHRSVAQSAFDGNYMTVDSNTSARLASWAKQVSQPGAGDVWSSGYWNGIGWAQSWRQVIAVFPGNATVQIGPSPSPDTHLNTKAYFHTMNLVAELDSPGEYVLNRSTSTLYAIPPAGASVDSDLGVLRGVKGSDRVVAHVSLLDAVVNVTAAAGFIAFNGIDFRHARGSVFIVDGAQGVSMLGGSVQSAGGTGINITNSYGFEVSGAVVADTGSGGIVLYGGNRTSLTPMGASARGVTVTRYNRVSRVYAAGVMLGGVGNSLVRSEVFDAPHMAIFWQGNEHVIEANHLHDVVQETRDSGAIYAGRDYTYSVTIANNLIRNVNTRLGENDPKAHNYVQAVYLDDMVSNAVITGNTIQNTSVALLLGGGRNNIFENNSIVDLCSPNTTSGGLGACSGSAVSFDNRGMGWAHSGCAPGGIQFSFLARVPFNTSAVWLSRYPLLSNITIDDICVPKYNSVSHNTYCRMNAGTFVDQSEGSLESWNSTAVDNIEHCTQS